MAIKINGDEVITNAKVLQNITGVDGPTGIIIVSTIRAENHSFVIRDSAGNETFRLHGVTA